MWQIKFVYKHSSCEYTPQVQRLGLAMQWYPLNTWVKGVHRYVSALLICAGEQAKINAFFLHIERISENAERIGTTSIAHVRKVPASDSYYNQLYDPRVIFLKPILHKNGLEYTELCSWEKEPLAALLLARRHAEDTEVLDLHTLRKARIDEVHVRSRSTALTSHQNDIFQFAREQGYYAHPRKITLGELARLKKMSKSAFHDALRRAESHLFPEPF